MDLGFQTRACPPVITSMPPQPSVLWAVVRERVTNWNIFSLRQPWELELRPSCLISVVLISLFYFSLKLSFSARVLQPETLQSASLELITIYSRPCLRLLSPEFTPSLGRQYGFLEPFKKVHLIWQSLKSCGSLCSHLDCEGSLLSCRRSLT